MTIIAAYDGGDKYWIASDSMGSGGGVMYELGSKLIVKGNYIVGFSWSYRVADMIRESKDLPYALSSIRDLRIIRDVVKDALTKDGLVGSNNNDHDAGRHKPDGHPLDLILISPSGIYTLETDYQIHKISDGYLACGSGTEIAMGSLYTCKALDINGKDAVKLAVRAANKHITTCGGRCHIKSVEKK